MIPGMADKTMDDPDRLLVKASTAAFMLDVSRSTVNRMIEDRRVRSVRLGPKVLRIPIEDVRAVARGE